MANGESDFYDRKVELSALERLWSGHGGQLVTLWGRRRIGKSRLLARFARDKRAIYLYGLRRSEADILRDLSVEAARVLGDPYLARAPFPDWSAALDRLTQATETERLLVVLDEFPYLNDSTPGLDTIVQRWWDRDGAKADLMLVIAGSSFSLMNELTGVRGALHGRRTAQLEVGAFDFVDAAAFYPHLQSVDRIRAYACLGGVPAYLQFWEPDQSIEQHLRSTVLRPDHVLFREPEMLLQTEFHQESTYSSILRAIAAGAHRPSEIALAVGKHSAADIFDHLERLRDLHIVARQVPITEQHQARQHRPHYVLADPFLRFWFRFVAPFQSLIQLGGGDQVWTREIAPALDEWVGRTTWEDVIIQAIWRLVQNSSISTPIGTVGRYWDKDTEIDVLGMWNDQVTLIGECKWTNDPLDERILFDLRRKSAKLKLSPDATVVLASRSGFTDGVRRRAETEPLVLLDPSTLPW
jgi:hypothetical protein